MPSSAPRCAPNSNSSAPCRTPRPSMSRMTTKRRWRWATALRCSEGRLVQIGTPDEIWRRPADTFVARSLGQPEINILDGVVDDGRIRLGDGSFDVPIPADAQVQRGD